VEEPTLLFVEDESLLVLVAQEALEAGGYSLIVAADGATALNILDKDFARFAGLLTDVRLGSGTNGWEVARHARKLQANLPIVYMTGDSAGDWPIEGVPNSVLVHKPYAPAQLVTAISTLMIATDTSQASSVS
jgi:CheY-like chemotaxis protein